MLTYNETKLGKVEATKDELKIKGQCVMDSRSIATEIALVDLAIDSLEAKKQNSSFPLEILVGGLGMGVVHHRLYSFPFTVEPEITTIELLPEIVEMHSLSQFYPYSKAVLPDSIVVADFLTSDYGHDVNDIIIMDIDALPDIDVSKRLRNSLTENGVLAIWTTENEVDQESILKSAKFSSVKKHTMPYNKNKDVTIYICVK